MIESKKNPPRVLPSTMTFTSTFLEAWAGIVGDGDVVAVEIDDVAADISELVADDTAMDDDLAFCISFAHTPNLHE